MKPVPSAPRTAGPLPWYRRPLLRSVALAVGAMALYGSWAYFANRDHGSRAALRAAGTQGFVSFTTTFTMNAIMEGLHRLGSRRLTRFVFPAVGALLAGVCFSIGMHLLMGTPEIKRTVTPILLIACTYTIIYSANLVRESIADERRHG